MKSEGIKQDIIQDKTASDLYDFLQSAAWKGIISESLSAHLRAAIKKIFSATAKPNEFWRDAKLPPNIDSLIAALREDDAGNCSEKTIDAYERRYYLASTLYRLSLVNSTCHHFRFCAASRSADRNHPSYRKLRSPESCRSKSSCRLAQVSARSSRRLIAVNSIKRIIKKRIL